MKVNTIQNFIESNKNPEILFWVGCAGSFDERYKKVTKAFIKISSLTTHTKIKLSDMYFNNIGNEKNYQHYKEVLRFILFDTIASTPDFELKKLLKKIYNY